MRPRPRNKEPSVTLPYQEATQKTMAPKTMARISQGAERNPAPRQKAKLQPNGG